MTLFLFVLQNVFQGKYLFVCIESNTYLCTENNDNIPFIANRYETQRKWFDVDSRYGKGDNDKDYKWSTRLQAVTESLISRKRYESWELGYTLFEYMKKQDY